MTSPKTSNLNFLLLESHTWIKVFSIQRIYARPSMSVIATQNPITTHYLVTTDKIIKWKGISSCRIEQHGSFVMKGGLGGPSGSLSNWTTGIMTVLLIHHLNNCCIYQIMNQDRALMLSGAVLLPSFQHNIILHYTWYFCNC